MRIATVAPLQAGKAVDRRGPPVTIRLSGEVETWWRDEGEDGGVPDSE